MYDKLLVDFKNARKKDLAWSEMVRELRLKSDKQSTNRTEFVYQKSEFYFGCVHILI